MKILLKNGTVYTMAQPDQPLSCDILIADGKIAALGPALSSEGAKTIDCTGLCVLPGLIDAHCHIGLFGTATGERGVDGNESSSACTPELRALDAVNPYDEEFEYARCHGITTVSTGPGSGNPIAGQFMTLKTHSGPLNTRILRQPSAMKMSFGENPKTAHQGKAPLTRMATAAIIRQALLRAQRYQEDCEEALATGKPKPAPDLGLEALLPVIRGELPVKAHAHRADDILTALRLADEFGLKMSIEHGSEAHVIVDQLSSAKGVILGPLLGFPHKLEVRQQSAKASTVLYQHGILFAIMSDLPASHTDGIILAAGACVREGLPPLAALEAITLSAARLLDVHDRVGSLEPGKDADIAVFTANPLERVSARCIMTFIDGQLVHDARQADHFE